MSYLLFTCHTKSQILIIPETIRIKLTSRKGIPLEIVNVFFGLKIFTSGGGYHNFSVLATDSYGQINLNRDEIIQNTEIESNDLSDQPTPFEFYIWEQNQLQIFKKRIEGLMKVYKDGDSIISELKSLGVQESKINSELKKVKEKEGQDRDLYERLTSSENRNLMLFEPKISGVWKSNEPITYELVTERKSTSTKR